MPTGVESTAVVLGRVSRGKHLLQHNVGALHFGKRVQAVFGAALIQRELSRSRRLWSLRIASATEYRVGPCWQFTIAYSARVHVRVRGMYRMV